jgi:hypothetical protein
MNWEAIGAIGEVAGAIGVIVTLIYLSVQLRQNSRLLRASSSSVINANVTSSSSLMVQDPEVARIYWQGLADRDALSESDRQRFDPLIAMIVSNMVQEYGLFLEGGIGERVWGTRMAGLVWQFRQPGMQQWWRDWAIIYEPEFQGFVNNLLNQQLKSQGS